MENTYKDKTILGSLKNFYIVLLIVIGLSTIIIPAVTGFVSINNNSFRIGKIDSRVVQLETDKQNNHDLLLELKFNMKKQMGKDYIEFNEFNKK